MRGWVRHARFYVPRGLMVTRCVAGRHSLRRQAIFFFLVGLEIQREV